MPVVRKIPSQLSCSRCVHRSANGPVETVRTANWKDDRCLHLACAECLSIASKIGCERCALRTRSVSGARPLSASGEDPTHAYYDYIWRTIFAFLIISSTYHLAYLAHGYSADDCLREGNERKRGYFPVELPVKISV